MQQVNFRVGDEEKRVLELLASHDGISVAEFTRKLVLKEISPIRVELAFSLLEKGKIGRKQAWTISGLSHHEFLVEWTRRGAEDPVPSEAIDKAFQLASEIDLDAFRRDHRGPTRGMRS